MPKLTDDKLQYWLELGFTAADIAQLARPISLVEIEARLAALNRPDPAQVKAQERAHKQEQRQAERARLIAATRPLPPEELTQETNTPLFAPAPELSAWFYRTFLESSGLLHNPEHLHLLDAQIGVLWTNVPNKRGGNQVAGQAEIPRGQGGMWSKARFDYQLIQWFGEIPDFLLTFDADYAVRCDDLHFCALIEHELYHCAQALDVFGEPKFSVQTGLPLFRLRGHDVEEFVGIVKRYGAGAAAGQTKALVDAAQRPPQVSAAKISAACGTCKMFK